MLNEDKVIGVLIGCAVGDSLGMPVEGWPKARIQKHLGEITTMIDPVVLEEESDEFGTIHNWTKDFKAGEVTDDTVFTLELAKSIIEDPSLNLDNIAQRHISVYEKFKAGEYKGGFGGTTKKAIRNLQKGIRWDQSGISDGLGTGPCMKMAPVGIWGAFHQNLEMSFIEKAEKIGKMTHLNDQSYICGILQAVAIYRLLISEIKKNDFLETLKQISRIYERDSKEKILTKKFSWIKDNQDVEIDEAHEYLSSGFVATEAYPFTVWMFQKYWNAPINGLKQTVNCGGDCDTTGAMFGALAGAKYGNIFHNPYKWFQSLRNRREIVDIGKKL